MSIRSAQEHNTMTLARARTSIRNGEKERPGGGG